VAQDEAECDWEEEEHRAEWRQLAEAYQAVLNGEPTPEQLAIVIPEIERHNDNFAPARATRFRPGDSGDRATFASLNALLRNLRAVAA
jgi:hypothetical protein